MESFPSYVLDAEARIAGGEVAFRGEFPHHVGILNGAELICGGSILSAVLILTAAHCLERRSPSRLRIIAGEQDRTDMSGVEQIRTVRATYIHPNFTKAGNSMKNDIGIILLNEALVFSKFVRNISLPQKGQEFSGEVTLVGWGARSLQNTVGNVLRKVVVPIVPLAECQRNYSRDSIPRQVTDTMLCAGLPGKDGCKGDSGGSALCYPQGEEEEEETPLLCGIVSWGEGCGEPGFPGVNTKVSSFIDWIEVAERRIRDRTRCRTDQFYCSSKCIPRSALCDFYPDCEDGTDESSCSVVNAPCNRTMFQCDNGRCARVNYICDHLDDCGDGTDELKCPVSNNACNLDEYQCGAAGRCIPNSWLCDGRTDCDDNSDERNCVAIGDHEPFNASTAGIASLSPYYLVRAKCATSKFYCSSTCISRRAVCDGKRDCADGTDEINCSNKNSCGQGSYRCGTGNCLLNSMLCDGDIDCLDASDETKCARGNATCAADEFQCGSEGRCIPKTWVADGMTDCEDDSDEKGDAPLPPSPTLSPVVNQTGSQCDSNSFECPAVGAPFFKTCFPSTRKCDGVEDCYGGTDEVGCEKDHEGSPSSTKGPTVETVTSQPPFGSADTSSGPPIGYHFMLPSSGYNFPVVRNSPKSVSPSTPSAPPTSPGIVGVTSSPLDHSQEPVSSRKNIPPASAPPKGK